MVYSLQIVCMAVFIPLDDDVMTMPANCKQHCFGFIKATASFS